MSLLMEKRPALHYTMIDKGDLQFFLALTNVFFQYAFVAMPSKLCIHEQPLAMLFKIKCILLQIESGSIYGAK